MEKEFVPYEIALELKELGFNETCFAGYDIDTKKIWIGNIDGYEQFNREFYIPVPIYQQAFNWFREKYDLIIEPVKPFQRRYLTEDDDFEILEFGYIIYSFDQFRGGLRNKIEWDGYENSNIDIAKLECLNKLIEINKIKNK